MSRGLAIVEDKGHVVKEATYILSNGTAFKLQKSFSAKNGIYHVAAKQLTEDGAVAQQEAGSIVYAFNPAMPSVGFQTTSSFKNVANVPETDPKYASLQDEFVASMVNFGVGPNTAAEYTSDWSNELKQKKFRVYAY